MFLKQGVTKGKWKERANEELLLSFNSTLGLKKLSATDISNRLGNYIYTEDFLLYNILIHRHHQLLAVAHQAFYHGF